MTPFARLALVLLQRGWKLDLATASRLRFARPGHEPVFAEPPPTHPNSTFDGSSDSAEVLYTYLVRGWSMIQLDGTAYKFRRGGVTSARNYTVSRPLPIAEALEFLRRHRWKPVTQLGIVHVFQKESDPSAVVTFSASNGMVDPREWRLITDRVLSPPRR